MKNRALWGVGSRPKKIEHPLKSLSLREQRVIELRYGLKGEGPWTCEEIGRHFGIHAVKIKQVENQALMKLREASVSEEDLVAQWNSVFPEEKGRRWFFRRGRSRSR
jgi:DNA-directed RNA polymerase sigma subunit (sigma70/sigma32)